MAFVYKPIVTRKRNGKTLNRRTAFYWAEYLNENGEMKRLVGDRVCLIGNVNCGLLDTGTEAECVESARYALRHGMPGGRYIFSTSNCIYTGMDLNRYDLILEVWRREGNYPA